MPDVSAGTLSLDLTQYFADLDKAGAAASQLLTTVQAAGDATTAKFSAAAQAQVQFSEKLASATAEVRAAQAATRSAADEVHRLADANRELAGAQSGLSKTSAEYTRLKGLIAANNEEIKKAKAAILENKAATEQERAAVQAVRDARREETNQTKLATAAAKDAAVAQKEAGAATADAGKEGGFLSGVLGKAGAAFAGLFAFSKLKQVAHDVIETTAEFERLEAVLTTINGGNNEKAERQFAQLRSFTLRNPFEVKEVTEGYVTLRNVGINPTITQLQALADLASASGKSFDTVTSSLLGATTGRFVQLKQFGITAKQQGDTVAFTFRGVTTVVEKTQEAISSYIFSLGQLNTVQGATERIMNTTGGRITNLKDSLTELFNTIGEGTDGPLNGFIKRLTDAATALKKTMQTSQEKAKNGSAEGVSTYEELVAKQFARVVERARTTGADVATALASSLADQQRILDSKQKLAEQQLKDFKQSTRGKLEGFGDQIADVADPLGTIRASAALAGGGEKASARDELEARVQLYKEQKKAAVDAAKAAQLASTTEADQLGLIEALQAKIKDEEEARARSTNRGEIHKYNLQIIADQKELDALLEKQEKTRKKQALSYEAQLRALLQERATLTSLAAKAAADSADDAAGKARAVFDESIRQVDVVQAKLEQRERDLARQARKAGGSRAVAGLGEKADGTVDGVQAEQLTRLRLAALDAYYESLLKITLEREQRLFDLRREDDAKEVEAIDRKYDQLIKRTTDGIERLAIEEARQRDQLALKASQEAKRIEQQRTLADATAGRVGQVFGSGTGISKLDAERNEQRQRLENEQKFLQDSLDNTLNKTGKEADIERQALSAQLARVKHQQDALTIQGKLSGFSIYRLILGENDSEETRAALDKIGSQVAQSLSQITDAEAQAAASRASAATQQINELSTQIQAQIALRQEGSASNIKGLLEEQNEQRRIRKEALEDQRRAAKEKVIIDALTQASSVATAAAEVLAVFAPLGPFGIVAGIAGAAAIIGAFTAAKVSAFQAANDIGKGFYVGGYTGDGDSKSESRALGKKPYTYHKGEFVFDHEKTAELRHALFEPLHNDQPERIDWTHPSLAALLPDHSLPGKLREERQASIEHHYRLSMEPLQAKFDGLESRLASIDATNTKMADRWDTHPTETGFLLIDPETKSTHHIRT